MLEIVKYKATDGSEWDSEADCLQRDALDLAIRKLDDRLGPAVKRGRRRIDPEVVARVKADVVSICRRAFPSQEVFRHEPSEIHPMSFAGRLLSEVGGPLNRIWYRFCCMNGDWEYEQPYFALNPDKFKPEEFDQPAPSSETPA